MSRKDVDKLPSTNNDFRKSGKLSALNVNISLLEQSMGKMTNVTTTVPIGKRAVGLLVRVVRLGRTIAPLVYHPTRTDSLFTTNR